MKKKTRKVILLTAKLCIAAALLVLVFGQVHWNDYVQAKGDGRTLAVLAAAPSLENPRRLRVSRGLWSPEVQWRPVEDFAPALAGTGQVIRPGFARTMRQIALAPLGLAAAGSVLSLLTIGVRWRYLLRIQGIRIRLWEVVRLTFLGQFFNAVVPGTVGGDLVKAYYVMRHTPRKAGVLVSIFLDRVMGLAMMGLMSATMVALVLVGGWAKFADVSTPALMVAVVLAIVGAAAAMLLSRRLRRVFRLEKLYQRLPIAHHFAAAGVAARAYRENLPGLAAGMLMTLVAQILFIGSIALLGSALALPAAWHQFFVYVPLIYILGAIPVTPGGVGVIEGAYKTFFAACTAPQVLALALLARLIPTFWGLPGLLVAITGPKLPKSEDIEAELASDEGAAG